MRCKCKCSKDFGDLRDFLRTRIYRISRIFAIRTLGKCGGTRIKAMKNHRTYWTNLPREEKANTLTHFFSMLATIVVAVPLLQLAAHSQRLTFGYQILGTALFVGGMFLMFASSTLYHAVTNPVYKARLRIFDHISIYVMIAGSYSLICLSVVGGWIGWSLFCFQWACVIAGAIGKFIALGKHPKLSLALYLAMGWAVLAVFYHIWHIMPHSAFAWILAEGFFYTTGAYFFYNDNRHAYYHAVWHVFIMLGALSHTIATWLILR